MIRTACLLLLAAPLVTAQPHPPEVRPGDPAIDVTPIRAGIDSLAIFVIDGQEAVPIGQYVIETTIQDAEITRVDRMLGREDQLLWGEEAVIQDRTLQPIAVRGLGERQEELRIGATSVERVWHEDGDIRREHEETSARSFHPTALDYVLRSLPLEAGYRVELVVLDPRSLTEIVLPVHVEREVAVTDVNGVRFTTLEVHVDLGGAVDVYHIDAETRALIRYESAADGMVMLRW